MTLGSVDAFANYIRGVLLEKRQPSARELAAEIERSLGITAAWALKSALETLVGDSDLTRAQRHYLRSLLESEDLARALCSDDAPDQETISTIDTLLQASRRYRESAGFQEMVQFMARFKNYAPYNNMLVRVQNPSCGFYATEKDWDERFERFLKEDAQPMLILAPKHPVLLVYDIDQTYGRPLPSELADFAHFEGTWNQNWLDHLVKNAHRHLIRVDFKTLSSTNAGFAAFDRLSADRKFRIAIHEELDEPSKFGVLCHEMAHILLGHLGCNEDGWWPSRSHLDRRTVEIEAEATAYVVTRHLGLVGTSHAYISRYLKDGAEVPGSVSFHMIAKVAGRIENMALGIQRAPRTKGTRRRRAE